MKKLPIVIIFLLAATIVASSAPLAFAQDETEPTPQLQPIYDIFKTLGYAAPIAVIVGLVTCMIGYLKSTPPESFKIEEFIYTFLISVIIGIATIYGGWTYAEISEWLANGCVTIWLYWIAKIIAKKLQWPTTTVTTAATGPPATA